MLTGWASDPAQDFRNKGDNLSGPGPFLVLTCESALNTSCRVELQGAIDTPSGQKFLELLLWTSSSVVSGERFFTQKVRIPRNHLIRILPRCIVKPLVYFQQTVVLEKLPVTVLTHPWTRIRFLRRRAGLLRVWWCSRNRDRC
ncbi:hypothetical protein pipiens_011710 [Culex pipiens pipiens]|uniref:Uncharacterized protein n=1 Tax=Culex pipiens pipiens TaxID=38569 RepID=A0ABD1D5B6_CULPP